MENDMVSAGQLALWENYRKHDGGCGCGCYSNGRSHGVASTALGLGSAGLAVAILAAWGINEASKARQKGSENTIAALTNNVNQLTNFAFMEHTNRANWQNLQTPSLAQVVDVRTGAQANAFSSAFANAESQIVSDALTGRSQICPKAVSIYSAPKPCDCVAPQCGCGCN